MTGQTPTSEAGGPGWFKTVGSRATHQGIFTRVRIDTIRMPDGSEAEREVVEQDDAVAVVPLLDDGTVILLRQYRHAVGGYLLEIPAGKLDEAGEDVESAAQRELAEEIHHRAGRLEHLLTVHNSAGWTDERTHIYLGTGMRPQTPPDTFEPAAEEADMEVVRVPLEEAVALVQAGRVTDAKTVVGLLVASRRRG